MAVAMLVCGLREWNEQSEWKQKMLGERGLSK